MSTPSTAFITWVHSDAGWDADRQNRWQQSLAEFAAPLSLNGVDIDIDLYHLHETGIDWTPLGPNKIEQVDYVLVAVSQACRLGEAFGEGDRGVASRCRG